MEYREITEKDIEKLAELFMESFNSEPFNENWTKETAITRLGHTFYSKDYYGFCAVENGEICGLIMGCFEQFCENLDFFLKEFAVKNDLRGQGIGTSMLKELEKRLKEKGVSNITFLTIKGDKTEHFYNKFGYKQHDEIIYMSKKVKG